MDTTEKSVGWFYAAYEDSESWDGPHPSREAAIQACREEAPEWDGFVVCEAFNAPLDLARYGGIADIFDTAEERLLDSDRINTEFEEGPFFQVTPDQEKDLIARLQATIATWQEEHGLVFTCGTFSHMDKMEHVV